MELEYNLQEEDLLALGYHQLATSPAVHRRLRKLRVGGALAFSLLAVLAYFTVPYGGLVIGCAVVATASLIAYPSFFWWKLRRDLPAMVRRQATPSSFSARKLRASAEGLEEITENARLQFGWAQVDAVYETPSHTLISAGGKYSVVIPRERVSSAAYSAFIEAVRKYRVAAA